ncbi:hypothetical protein TWF703_004729 [Orbilia oligospora]|uniref:DNA (cytosine-5-)-methyltransferase n=1 Tax=Orbilia oligospora TaxID=2813651 RepID=A0A7C8JTH0_ORBOL|nr:hypothetical protein TWF703_004729 [Orbilia oligospora]
MSAYKRSHNMMIDLTMGHDKISGSKEVSNGTSPNRPNTPKRRRGPIQIKGLPRGLIAVTELSIFKEKKAGSNGFQEIALNIGGCVEIEKGTILEGETKPLTVAYFVRITKILTCHEGQYVVGKLFKRVRHGHGLFDKVPGEVFWLRDKVTVSVKYIVRVRELVLTNHTELTCGGILPRAECATQKTEGWQDGEDSGRLICRRRANLRDNAEDREGSAKHVIGDEGFVRLLEEFEADEAFRYPRKLIKSFWTSEKDEIVAIEKAEIEEKAIDLTIPISEKSKSCSYTSKKTYKRTTISESNTGEKVTSIVRTSKSVKRQNTIASGAPGLREPVNKHQYTFGDFFCGAGGASCGAKIAGLKIAYGVDKWEDALMSYERNYGKSKAIKADICEFAANPFSVSLPASRLYADVIHLSCPCQFYSPVHTVPGKNDEMNEVASLVVDRLLKVVRPRVVTSEQTFGINSARKFKDHFAIVINQYVRNNYSVRWAVKDATEYGAVSARRRLIVIASCPGEPVPNFPPPTSFNPFRMRGGPNSQGLPTTPTIGQVLSTIPANADNHNFRPYPHPKPSPFHLNQPFNKTITCDGGEGKVHPNGKRPFTPRELATFQTFPISYKFSCTSDTSIIKQVGNAWPPKFAGAIYRAIVKHLERLDKEADETEIL